VRRQPGGQAALGEEDLDPRVVEPVWLPITPPATPPAAPPMTAPLVVLFMDAQPDPPTNTSAARSVVRIG